MTADSHTTVSVWSGPLMMIKWSSRIFKLETWPWVVDQHIVVALDRSTAVACHVPTNSSSKLDHDYLRIIIIFSLLVGWLIGLKTPYNVTSQPGKRLINILGFAWLDFHPGKRLIKILGFAWLDFHRICHNACRAMHNYPASRQKFPKREIFKLLNFICPLFWSSFRQFSTWATLVNINDLFLGRGTRDFYRM